MRIWIVNPYDNLPLEGYRPQRYWLMARAFARAGHEVVYWTSDFSHATKAPRRCCVKQEERGLQLVQIPTRPYPRNICLARVISHRALAADFRRRALQESADEKRPQVVVASMPPLGLCAAARQVATARGALFIADVQDAWPETFERLLPRFVWFLIGMRRTARRIYRDADGVSAVAQRYLDLAKAYGSAAPMHLAGHAIAFAREDSSDDRPGADRMPSPLKLVYAGNMSLSYDLETIIRVVSGRSDVTLDLAGNGPDRARLEQLPHGGHVRFHGYLDSEALRTLLRQSDVGLIPMFPESCVGVPGKLADYAAAGVRVIESLGGETAEIVDAYRVGGHYRAGDAESFAAALERMKVPLAQPADRVGFKARFDATRIMDDYVKWVDELVAGRNPV